jgi:two-component system, chemotaxis family, chemotaxis protein CheY
LDISVPVLVVDDSGITVGILRRLLRQIGFIDVDDANDGAAALALMRRRRYGLVISDWNMEQMSGYRLPSRSALRRESEANIIYHGDGGC